MVLGIYTASLQTGIPPPPEALLDEATVAKYLHRE